MKPSAVAAGDVSGDGKADVVTANFTDNTVSVLLATTGGLAPQVTYRVGTNPASVALADLNGDGKLDIVTANSASQTVSVLLNKGSGTYANQVTYTVGTAPLSVAIGDLNADGKPDLAVANSVGVGMFGTVSVLLGVGDGTFQNQAIYGAGQTPSWLTLGDIDGDGHVDLITANSGVSGNAPFGGVSVLVGKGDGTFTAKTVGTPSRPYSVTVADFNKDGRLDIVTAELVLSNTIYSRVGGLILQLAKSDGTFSTAADTEFGPGNPATFLATLDFNGDGNPDFVAGPSTEGNFISVFLGDGKGAFPFQFACLTSTAVTAVASGDITGDGVLDLVVATSANTVQVFPGNGMGSVNAAALYPTDSAAAVAIGDLNGDSNPDLVVANSATNTVGVLLGNGAAPLQLPVTYPVGTTPIAVALGDLNGDGHKDLVVANGSSNTVSTLLNNGDGTFEPQTTYPVDPGPTSIILADLNNDSRLDVATANTGTNTVSVLLGKNDGTFGGQITYPMGARLSVTSSSVIAVGDVNGDGSLDFVTSNNVSTTLSVLLGAGDGTFANPTSVAAGPASAVALGDLNGDHKLDLVVAPSGSSAVKVLFGNGDGTFGTPTNLSLAYTASAVAVADLNGDGKLDIVVADVAAILVFLGAGDGTFATALPYAASGSTAAGFGVGDLTGDGKVDIAAAQFTDVMVLVGKGDGTFR